MGVFTEAGPLPSLQILQTRSARIERDPEGLQKYDAIVVGARCAGSPISMLLARKGYRVLLVDKAPFPSDTISTHILWPHGAEILGKWGLAPILEATGLPPICRRMRFDVGPFALYGSITTANEGRGGFCPRRQVLDSILLGGADASGVEIREAFAVSALVFDGDTVVGIRGRQRGGATVEERARIVIGADGIHSLVAREVQAHEYDRRPIAVCAYYSYFSDIDQDDIELFVRENCAFGGAPTNDGLHMVMVNWPSSQFEAVRADIDRHVQRVLELSPDFAARVQEGKRVEKWHGTIGVPNYFRQPYGKGWALAGDAGYNRDPITAQGMSDAFIQAQELADAIDAGFSGRVNDIEESLTRFAESRDARVRSMYEFTFQLAALEPPPPPMQMLFGALRNNPEGINAFFSAITGATPLGEFMAPENLSAIVGATTAP